MLQNLAGRNMKIKEGIMLERIMDLHLLLYTMTALGALGAVGMLAVHLTYRRAMRKTKAVMKGQASQQDESSCVGTVASFSGVPGTGSFFSHQART